ncbi:MAG: putative sulfoacetate transporter SauU [Chlamydiae bacterium]|nr:putative sulfoacetate transporter SauU [Chlamydiota bacterium]
MSSEKAVSSYRFFIWGLEILFYFYEFFLRVLPATVASDIISSLDMSAEQFAFIGSAYYITYAIMQIPVGLLLDRFSAKLLVTSAVALCACGAFWFSFAQTFSPAFISRLLIGLGSSFGFITLIVVTLNWFPKKHFAFLIGCGQFLGAVGPLSAGVPIAYMLKIVDGDWRKIFLWVALFGFLLTAFFLLFFKGKPTVTEKIIFVDRKDSLSVRLKNLLFLPQVWWTLLYAGLVYVAIPILGAFWGVSYLETRGLQKPVAAFVISMIWVGLAVGSPLLGKISDAMCRRKPVAALSAAIGLAGSLMFLFIPEINEYFLSVLFFLIGLGGAGQNLSFAIMSEHAPKVLRATAVSLNNTAVMGFGALLPLIVTAIIHSFALDGRLTVVAFEKGFLALPVCFGIALFISIFMQKETFCRQQNIVHRVEKSS